VFGEAQQKIGHADLVSFATELVKTTSPHSRTRCSQVFIRARPVPRWAFSFPAKRGSSSRRRHYHALALDLRRAVPVDLLSAS